MTTEPIRIAAFDIDGTLFRWSFLIEIVERLVRVGKISEEAYENARLLKQKWRRRETSFADYSNAIIAIVEGRAMRTVKCSDLVEVAKDVVDEHGRNIYVFTRELLAVVRDHGYRTVAISGSVREAVDLFAKMWGIDDVLATELEHDDAAEFFTGRVYATPVHDKAEALHQYMLRLHAPAFIEIAVGDTRSDLGMLRMAKWPIAFNPDHALKAHARTHGLVCVTERKDAVTILSAPGQGQRKIVPRFFSEASVANVLPRDVGMELKARLHKLGYEHL